MYIIYVLAYLLYCLIPSRPFRPLIKRWISQPDRIIAASTATAMPAMDRDAQYQQRSDRIDNGRENAVVTLLIDNYDSYTYNIWQLLAAVNGAEPVVIFNDQFASWDDMIKSIPSFDNIVLSPGPGSVSNHADFGLCREAIMKSNVPLLGVCLGHQGIAHVFGLTVERAERPVHGEQFAITHSNEGIFENIPQNFMAVRYHSLVAKPPGLSLSLSLYIYIYIYIYT